MKALKTMLAAAWFALILAMAPDGSAAEADCYGQENPVHWAKTSDIRNTRYRLRGDTPLRAVNSDESWATSCAVTLIWRNSDEPSKCKGEASLNGASLSISKALDVTLEIPSQKRTVKRRAVSSNPGSGNSPNYWLKFKDDKSEGNYYVYIVDIINMMGGRSKSIPKVYRVEYFKEDAGEGCHAEEPTNPGVITEEVEPQSRHSRKGSSTKKESSESLSHSVRKHFLQTDVGSGPEPKPKG